MAYFTNTPILTDNLSVSAVQMNTNFATINTVFGIDHYDFTVAVPNGGYHKAVTTPDQVNAPSTASTVASFYGLKPSTPVGIIQFSRGPSSPVPSPVTYLQSTSPLPSLGAGLTSNVLDFTGLSVAMAEAYAFDTSSTGPSPLIAQAIVTWTGSTLLVNSMAFSISGTLTNATKLFFQTSGNILQIKNSTSGSLTGVYWTLQLLRIS